ncbi:tRNA (N6-threonylcarbamoyladenosine(37)-N6)-methyltransferase TrmO [Desulfobulbus rhabdoformis]|jgi:tRNA-Thr(GGU) m(6)t(6)A37 methyltransferase TsaA|uniref:tRNA (N6-threonylcarbamoyladenosine(37)-N6)-methyltransferase TrmO n=1 Tax=Desulfobulbus rhabdoformis TaxID=34032 RepID=UPI0019626B9D|nr:tRNA (N6-threonylcarbamoyladenosine(37)-N6)-methyltransferase TrmO [Desulfobulbus rhabdoformis]MBM9613645.1 tRNA (N6-threonylcarbamoyladenosine(37)-N6)-methyltransferase TrmO [Desulfobulbus rhabdoformis]
MQIIAHIQTDFSSKFGIPRQSGLVEELVGKIIFTPPYRNKDAVRGLEGFSHIWLLWHFSQAHSQGWSPTVRPPRLGGDTRMGVFATRSPFRPNNIGLSSLTLDSVELHTGQGPILWVRGVDMLNNTPILDIKPYLAYTDSHPEANQGFTQHQDSTDLEVIFLPEHRELLSSSEQRALTGVLSQDPRPRYQNDPNRTYGFSFGRWNITFQVCTNRLRVLSLDLT